MVIFARILMLATLLSISLHTKASFVAYSDPDILLYFQSNAPADTTFYTDGLVAGEMTVVAESLAVYNLQLELLVTELETLNADQYSAEIEFLVTLLRHGLAAQTEGQDALFNYYGLDDNLASAFYLDGLIPVLQLAIFDKQPLINALGQASKQSGVVHKTQVWGRHPVDYWVLQTEQDLGFDLWLAVATKGKVASIALIPAHLSQARRLDVLGLLPEAYSLADSHAMAYVRETEGFLNYTAGFVNLLEIVRLVTDPHASKAGEDLIALSGRDALPLVSVACRRDWLDLAQGMPKLVFGYDSIYKQASETRLDGHMLLQIEDADITQALQQLNGHLPNYSLSPKDVLLSAALGLNMSALVPVISQLRRQVLSAHFDCQELVEIQGELISVDLSMLMVAAAVGQGVSGIGGAIYDIDLSAIARGNFAIDTLISVSTEHPELLSNLASLLPQLEGVEVPSDSSSIALNLPNLPAGLNPKLAHKGKHIVIFDGSFGAESAQQMSFEQLNKRGIFAASTNYNKLGKLANDALDLVANMYSTEASECAELHVNLATLNDLAVATTIIAAVEDEGIRFDFNTQIPQPNHASSRRVKAGHYQLKKLADNCIWLTVGNETIKADGSGHYEISDDTEQCAFYKARYEWQQQGRRLVFRESESLGRDSCSENMEAMELQNSACLVINVSNNGFDCLFTPSSDGRQIYRYVLHPNSS
jgi:hypothetical protein